MNSSRTWLVKILQEESSLMDIVKLIGADVLPEEQKLVLEIARVIRVGFLQQNAYHQNDTYVPLDKQYKMLEIILYLYDKCRKWAADEAIPVSLMLKTGIFDKLIKIKYDVANDELSKFDDIKREIDEIKF